MPDGVRQNCFKALSDEDPWVRFFAVKSVAAACESDMSSKRSREMLNDRYVPVIMAAIDIIREIGGREAFESLSPHENMKIRMSARK